MDNDCNEQTPQYDSRAQSSKNKKRRERFNFFLMLITAAAIALSLRFFVFELVRVEGSSMENTLHDNEYVFMERVTYWFRSPDFGDIVICTYPDEPGKTFVKRIIGLPSDKILISNGTLYINGKPDSTYFSEPMFEDFGPYVVPECYFFVMGDNRNNSKDSRIVGPLDRNRILGKAAFVIWPPAEIHGLS